MNEYQIEIEIEKLKKENEELKAKLEKYVATDRHRNYYQENKEEIKQRNKEYREKTNYTISAEKKKQYAKTAYLNKKAKQENI
jgi:hypothetical protein